MIQVTLKIIYQPKPDKLVFIDAGSEVVPFSDADEAIKRLAQWHASNPAWIYSVVNVVEDLSY